MRSRIGGFILLAASLIGLFLGGCGNSVVAELLPVGSACTADPQCGPAPFMCMLDHPGGYCLRDCRSDVDCPSESVCVVDTDASECHKRCPSGQLDCRAGYECAPAASSGFPRSSVAFCDVSASPDAGATDSSNDPGG